MPRAQRIQSSSGIYHAMLRGINQQRIFEETEDYQRFLKFISEAKEYTGCSLLAYCLMNNHVHLLLMEDAEKDESNLMALSQFFLYLGTRYAQWFNKKYQRSGHLFQNRYRSEAVQDDAYLITVIGYIHQNPVKARLCDRPQDYQWSSRQLLGRKGSLVDEERLSQFVSIADIKAYDTATVEAVMGEGGYGRRPRFSESVAASLICDISAAQTTTQFLALPSDAQRQAVRDLRARHMPIRQIARLTGLSKGMVERWGEG